MRLALGCLIAATALFQAPALADPSIKTAMPAIGASISNGQLVVRMERNLTGAVHNMEPRTLQVLARDAEGKVVFESTTAVTNRMTYARIPATPALTSAATIAVSLR
jgi:hypothetical protein